MIKERIIDQYLKKTESTLQSIDIKAEEIVCIWHNLFLLKDAGINPQAGTIYICLEKSAFYKIYSIPEIHDRLASIEKCRFLFLTPDELEEKNVLDGVSFLDAPMPTKNVFINNDYHCLWCKFWNNWKNLIQFHLATFTNDLIETAILPETEEPLSKEIQSIYFLKQQRVINFIQTNGNYEASFLSTSQFRDEIEYFNSLPDRERNFVLETFMQRLCSVYAKFLQTRQSQTIVTKEGLMSIFRKKNKKIKANAYAKGDASDLLLSKNVRYSTDRKLTKYNSNILVLGATGSGECFCNVRPNLSRGEESKVVIDPHGELYRTSKEELEKAGYQVSRIDFTGNKKGDYSYDTMLHIQNEKDIYRLSKILLQDLDWALDPFFAEAKCAFLESILYYLFETKKTFTTSDVLKLLRLSGEGLHALFVQLGKHTSDSFAIHKYNNFLTGSSSTCNSIHASVAARLAPLLITGATSEKKEIDFSKLQETKQVIFLQVATDDRTFYPLVTSFLTQLLESLHDQQGTYPIRLVLIDFMSIPEPPNFAEMIASTRNIRITVCVQSLGQLSSQRRDVILGICSIIISMGVIDQKEAEYLSSLCGLPEISVETILKLSAEKEIVVIGEVAIIDEKISGREQNLL